MLEMQLTDLEKLSHECAMLTGAEIALGELEIELTKLARNCPMRETQGVLHALSEVTRKKRMLHTRWETKDRSWWEMFNTHRLPAVASPNHV